MTRRRRRGPLHGEVAQATQLPSLAGRLVSVHPGMETNWFVLRKSTSVGCFQPR